MNPLKFEDPRLPTWFWNKAIPEPNSGCWLWLGTMGGGGYGEVRLSEKRRIELGIVGSRFALQGNLQAHRVTFLCVEELPEPLVIDHRCRTRCCVNPLHMEAVTIGVNVLRGVGHVAEQARQTRCKNGHPFEGEGSDAYVSQRRRRVCRICTRAKKSRAYLQHHDAINKRRREQRASRSAA